MIADISPEWVARLAALPEAERRKFVARMRPGDLLHWDAMFECWSSAGQLPPSADGWRVWLMMAGRGFGKTRAGAEWVHRLAGSGRRRFALIGASIDEARRVMVEGPSGLLAIARRRRVKLKWEASLGRLTWPQGSVAELFSGDHPDGLRGPEHDFAWADELAKWRRAEEAWANLDMGLRRGIRPRVLVTTTPKPMPLLERLQGRSDAIVTGGRTMDNASLPQAFVRSMIETYGGTRLGRQELEGELMPEADGSLFPRALIEAARGDAPERSEFDRVVVAVDPPASAHGDECGIVVAGRAGEQIWVLDDASEPPCRPERWAAKVAAVAAQWDASHVVAEGNQGGAMVESVLKAADAGLRVAMVHASRGKAARAEPVALRMERGTVRLGGVFPALETQLSGLTAAGGWEGAGSPDRADACVWAVTELSATRSGVPRVRAL